MSVSVALYDRANSYIGTNAAPQRTKVVAQRRQGDFCPVGTRRWPCRCQSNGQVSMIANNQVNSLIHEVSEGLLVLTLPGGKDPAVHLAKKTWLCYFSGITGVVTLQYAISTIAPCYNSTELINFPTLSSGKCGEKPSKKRTLPDWLPHLACCGSSIASASRENYHPRELSRRAVCMTNVIIADHQAIFRAGVAKVLAVEDDIRIVGQPQSHEQMLNALGALARPRAAGFDQLPAIVCRNQSSHRGARHQDSGNG